MESRDKMFVAVMAVVAAFSYYVVELKAPPARRTEPDTDPSFYRERRRA